jgi:hypothetical protein
MPNNNGKVCIGERLLIYNLGQKDTSQSIIEYLSQRYEVNWKFR